LCPFFASNQNGNLDYQQGGVPEKIKIKNGWNPRNIFNAKCIIIQFSQLQGGMEGKRHFLKAFDDIENKKVNLEHVERI
jgi:hypothetical protein